MQKYSWIFWWIAVVMLILFGAIMVWMWYLESSMKMVNIPVETEAETILEMTEATIPPSETAVVSEISEDTMQTGKTTNILLIGQDSREGEEARLADTILLCSLNPDEKKLTVTSFMRDLYVRMPVYESYGGDMNRINVTYAIGYVKNGDTGGMEMTARCVEENFKVKIDGVVVVGFDAFVNAVEAMGGIAVELDEAEAAYLSRTTENEYTAGMNELNGWDVLTYVRMRHSSPRDSDFFRTARQRKAIASMVSRCRSMNIIEKEQMLEAVLPLITTNLSAGEIISLGIQLLPVLNQLEIESRQCPAEGTYHGEMVDIYGTKAGVLVPDLEKNRAILRTISGV